MLRTRGDEMMRLLKVASKENHILLNEVALKQLEHYLHLLQKWNRIYNLTTITTPSEMVYLHIIDSLIIQPYLVGNDLLDVGTGAGLPGIPLAILNPTSHFTLLDKNNKKTRFLTQVVAELGLQNVRVVHARSEDYQDTKGFDVILFRAVGSLAMLIESTQHLLRVSGRLLAMKGKYPQDEITGIPAEWQYAINELTIQGWDVERHLVCLKK